MYLYYVKALAFQNHNLCKKRHWHWILNLTTSLMQRHSLYMHIYVLIMKQLLLADEVVVNSTKLFWFQHFLWCWSFWWHLWEFAGSLSTSVLAAVQVADVGWHRTPATMMWYYLTLEEATSRSSANRHPVSSTHTYTSWWRILQFIVWMTNSVTHTKISNLGELHNYESVNTANTPKLIWSRYRHKEHPKGKRKPQPAAWVRLIVDCA